jgi:hypothetical protein
VKQLQAPKEDKDYLEARAGDHLFCPFECDYCTFHQLKGCPPFEKDKTDDILLTYLHQANLDAFWSRQPGTINGMHRMFTQQVLFCQTFGFEMFEALGPFSRSYDSGIRTAIGVLHDS